MRADWTAFGACTSGSTAHPRGATSRACGGAGTTSTASAEMGEMAWMWIVMMVAMMLPSDAGTAWRHGLRLGLHCSGCCVGLMAILLVIGVMDLRAMAVVAAAITVERLAPGGERVAQATGAVVVGAGLFLIARAAGLD